MRIVSTIEISLFNKEKIINKSLINIEKCKFNYILLPILKIFFISNIDFFSVLKIRHSKSTLYKFNNNSKP